MSGGSPEPVHERRHPPFEGGNQAARTHAVYAADVTDKAREVLQWLYAPELVERYPAIALMGAEVWVRRRRALTYIEDEGLVDGDGDANPLLVVVDRCERRLLDLSKRFGLDPRSEVEVRRVRADAALAGFDLDQAVAAGREVIDARAVEKEDET